MQGVSYVLNGTVKTYSLRPVVTGPADRCPASAFLRHIERTEIEMYLRVAIGAASE